MSNTKMALNRVICPACRTEFYKHCEAWGWMFKHKEVCSYHCMRALERAEQAKEEARYRDRRGKKQAGPAAG